MKIPGSEKKRDETNIKNFGFANPFQSEEIKLRIKKRILELYGNESFTRSVFYNQRRIKTSLEKYGRDSHMKTEKYKILFSGENSPVWKGGINNPSWERLSPRYKEWRDNIFIKYNYTCVKCNTKGGYIEAHHILNWSDNPNSRYDITNGIVFCLKCHCEFHRIYGKKNNNLEQLTEYLF